MTSSSVRRHSSSISLPQELNSALLARAASLDLPPSRYLRHLLRNDLISPHQGLARIHEKLKPSKFTFAHLPTSLPHKLKTEALRRAAEEGLDLSSYIVTLVLKDLSQKNSDFIILGPRT